MDSPAFGVCSDVESSIEYHFGRITAFLCACPKRCRCGHANPHKPGSPAAMRFAYGLEDAFAAMRREKKESK